MEEGDLEVDGNSDDDNEMEEIIDILFDSPSVTVSFCSVTLLSSSECVTDEFSEFVTIKEEETVVDNE